MVVFDPSLKWRGKSSAVTPLAIFNLFKGRTMNKDQIKGRVDQAAGKVKQTAGKVVGNTRLQAEGTVEQVKGKVQAGLGDAKQATKDKMQKVAAKI